MWCHDKGGNNVYLHIHIPIFIGTTADEAGACYVKGNRKILCDAVDRMSEMYDEYLYSYIPKFIGTAAGEACTYHL